MVSTQELKRLLGEVCRIEQLLAPRPTQESARHGKRAPDDEFKITKHELQQLLAEICEDIQDRNERRRQGQTGQIVAEATRRITRLLMRARDLHKTLSDTFERLRSSRREVAAAARAAVPVEPGPFDQSAAFPVTDPEAGTDTGTTPQQLLDRRAGQLHVLGVYIDAYERWSRSADDKPDLSALAGAAPTAELAEHRGLLQRVRQRVHDRIHGTEINLDEAGVDALMARLEPDSTGTAGIAPIFDDDDDISAYQEEFDQYQEVVDQGLDQLLGLIRGIRHHAEHVDQELDRQAIQIDEISDHSERLEGRTTQLNAYVRRAEAAASGGENYLIYAMCAMLILGALLFIFTTFFSR